MARAIVLRLLRESAKRWWWYVELRKQGRIAEAERKERESIRNMVATMRTCEVEHIYLHGVVTFLPPKVLNAMGHTVSISNVPPQELAAWIYVYAQRLGAQR